jgi:hypothetical protein
MNEAQSESSESRLLDQINGIESFRPKSSLEPSSESVHFSDYSHMLSSQPKEPQVLPSPKKGGSFFGTQKSAALQQMLDVVAEGNESLKIEGSSDAPASI